jgi:tetratricopeptide (TPR) repeat protein
MCVPPKLLEDREALPGPRTVRRSASFALATGLLMLASLAPTPLSAQDAHAGHSATGALPEEILSRPVTLRTGIGPYHEKVTTSSAVAQSFYDQGVAYLHSYVWIEAARSFHQALRNDPKMAMAYLGLSYAYSPMDYEAARAALGQAKGLSAAASDREKRRIAIRDLQLAAMVDPSNAAKLLAFRQAIDEALAVYPDDVELLLLRGQAEEPTPFGDGQGCTPSAIPFYRHALTISPDNFAAHHYLTHCYENQGRFTEALAQAEIYARMAPQIPHAQHMYGHELRCTGQVEEALQYFLRADQLENAYYRRENIPPVLDWHHAHNLSLLASAYQYTGRIRQAEQYFSEEDKLAPLSDYAAFNHKDLPEFLLNRGEFARSADASGQMIASPGRLARVAGHALAGTAFASLQRQADANGELRAALNESTGLSPPDLAAAAPYLDLLRLTLLFKYGPISDAPPLLDRVQRYTRAATSADSWSQGLFRLEVLANAARQAGRWEIAGQLAALMLQIDPYYGGSHYALALVAEHQGDAAMARQEFAAAEKYWVHADRDFPELLHAQAALTTLG